MIGLTISRCLTLEVTQALSFGVSSKQMNIIKVYAFITSVMTTLIKGSCETRIATLLRYLRAKILCRWSIRDNNYTVTCNKRPQWSSKDKNNNSQSTISRLCTFWHLSLLTYELLMVINSYDRILTFTVGYTLFSKVPLWYIIIIAVQSGTGCILLVIR